MSGDELRSVGTRDGLGDGPEGHLRPLLADPTRPARPEQVDDVVTESLVGTVCEAIENGDSTVQDGLVTGSLDEILLALIALSKGETHGTMLMDELSRRFEADLSPGTVYPRLHGLDEEGLLDVHELVQTKQYDISDAATGRERVQRAMEDHLAIATFLAAALENL